MAQQIVKTKYISRTLSRFSGEEPITISVPKLTAQELGVSAQNNTLFSERYVKNLKARINISSLPYVPVPVFGLGMSEDEKFASILENEKNNPHKLMQILTKEDNLGTEWGEIGSVLMLNRNQSYNAQLSIFFTSGDILEMSGDALLSVRMVPDGHGVLSGQDWIHIYGLYKEVCTVFPNEQNQIAYNHRSVEIPPGQVVRLAAENSERRYLRVCNTNTANLISSAPEPVLWMQEIKGSGSGVPQKVGAAIYSKGSFEWNWNYLEPPLTCAIWGYSVEGLTVSISEGS